MLRYLRCSNFIYIYDYEREKINDRRMNQDFKQDCFILRKLYIKNARKKKRKKKVPPKKKKKNSKNCSNKDYCVRLSNDSNTVI